MNLRLRLAAFLLALSLPLPAMAQVGPEVYKPISAQFQTISGTALSITTAMVSRMFRITCSISCFYNVQTTGNTVPATRATGHFLAPLVPQEVVASPGSSVSVIGWTATGLFGTFYISELTK